MCNFLIHSLIHFLLIIFSRNIYGVPSTFFPKNCVGKLPMTDWKCQISKQASMTASKNKIVRSTQNICFTLESTQDGVIFLLVCKMKTICDRKRATYNWEHGEAVTSWEVQFLVGKEMSFPGVSMVNNPPAKAGDSSSIPGSGRSSGEENGNPLQYSCLENPMDREAWWATVPGITKESHLTQQLNN